MTEAERSGPDAARMLDRILAAGGASAVFSLPVQNGAYTVITACEIASGGGFGFGQGVGPAESEESGAETTTAATGSGGGGGGGSKGRPVAAIIIGPDGVVIKPIVDPTRIALTAIIVWGIVALALGRFCRWPRT